MSDFIKRLQDKPEKTRTRILFVTSGVAAIAVFSIWLATFKHQIGSINGSNTQNPSVQTSQASQPHYLSVSRAEVVANKLNVYFAASNDTNDILDFSKLNDINLNANGKNYNPTQVTDRQGQPYVSKVLSHGQNFGILTFDANAKSGQITFDNLSFEQSPTTLFKETLDLDFDKLESTQDIRE